MTSGIYTITAPSGSQYVGSAVDFGSRWRVHRHHLRKGNHFNRALTSASKKYGLDALVFAPLLICRKQDLLFFEQRAIDAMRPKYNACPTAGSQLGRKQRPESIARTRAANTGQKRTPEIKAAAAARMRGNRLMVGRTLSAATKQKVSVALRGGRHADGFESKVTDDQRQEIVADYTHMSLADLERTWKTSHKALRRILIAAGVSIRPTGLHRQNGS